jgi:hypothetical protein
MSVSLRSFAFSRLAKVVIAASLWCPGPASAGDGGGEDAATLQQSLNAICSEVGMISCPTLPTVAQIVLEISGLINSPPDDVRNIYLFTNALPTCGNLFFPEIPCPQQAINAINAPVRSPSADATVAMSYLTPLSFKPGAVVTQYGDPAAKRFLYATVLDGTDGQPQILDLLLDDTLATNKRFSKGPVAAFQFPLVVLKNGIETPVEATLKLTAICNEEEDCLTSAVTGITGPGTTPPSAAQLGIQVDTSFHRSPNSKTAHRIYELQIPLVATVNNDGAYFASFLSCANGHGANLLSGYCNAFSTEKLGFPAPVLGSGASVGIAPYAAPLCTAATCPPPVNPPPNPPPPPPTTYFDLCATFANVPAANVLGVATFLQIGTDGTTAITTPVNTQGIQCPSQN